jgi:ABC-type polysaccharide/polyol phosphate transport system ATPase subunit
MTAADGVVHGLRTSGGPDTIGALARLLAFLGAHRTDDIRVGMIRQLLDALAAATPRHPALDWYETTLAFARGTHDRRGLEAVRAWQRADPLAARFTLAEAFLTEGDRPLPPAPWTFEGQGEHGTIPMTDHLSVWKAARGQHLVTRPALPGGAAVIVDGLFKKYIGDDDTAFVEVEAGDEVIHVALGGEQVSLGSAEHTLPVLLPGRLVPFRLAVLPGESWLFLDGVWAVRAPRAGAAAPSLVRFGVRPGARGLDANSFWAAMRVLAGGDEAPSPAEAAPVPGLATHLVDVAAAWLANGRPARASQALLVAAALDPSPFVLDNLGRLARGAGEDLDPADPALARALGGADGGGTDAAPGEPPRAVGLDADGFTRLRDALALLDRGRFAEARVALAAAAERHPSYPAFRHMMPAVMAGLGDDAAAVAAFRELQADDPLQHRFSRAAGWMGRQGGPLPGPDVPRVVQGAAGSDTAAEALVVFRQQAGSLLFEIPLEGRGGALVFEAMVRKTAGSDDACVIELDWGAVRERVAVNGGFVVLKGAAQVARVRPPGRYAAVRLACHGGEVRVYVDGAMMLRRTGLPAESPRALRFGLAEGSEPVDTSSQWSSVRVAFDPRPRVDHARVAPFPRFAAHLANVGRAWLELGNRERALHCLEAALESDPRPEIVAGFEQLVERIAGDLDPADERFQRCVRAVEAAAGSERAERLLTLVRQQRHELAVSCRNVSIYFAKAPHRVSHPLEIARRLLDRRRYFEKNYWWAVKDVSFDVRYGEVVAVIGNNGAGKSTLLRAIAGILDHQGTIVVNGSPRLLVMGLGVQEELTGRENVALGCVYLGLRRREIVARTEEILDFAELTAFADTPYKYYSDGMKARLMFSIATSVEPDILLLDELLGAGDVTFRAKAMERMDRLVERSKAMVVVTHNLAFVRDRARRALYLERGRVVHYGDPHRAVDLYLDRSAATPEGRADALLEEV